MDVMPFPTAGQCSESTDDFSPSQWRPSDSSYVNSYEFPPTPVYEGLNFPYHQDDGAFPAPFPNQTSSSQASSSVYCKDMQTPVQSRAIPNRNGEMTDKHSRRRLQNRMSQQAFRKRREKYIKDLESQLEELDKKHKDFLRVSSRKVDSCLQVLTNEINALEALRDLLHREHVHPGQLNINSGWDKFCTGPECCIDERTAYQNHGFDSSVMEDNR